MSVEIILAIQKIKDGELAYTIAFIERLERGIINNRIALETQSGFDQRNDRKRIIIQDTNQLIHQREYLGTLYRQIKALDSSFVIPDYQKTTIPANVVIDSPPIHILTPIEETQLRSEARQQARREEIASTNEIIKVKITYTDGTIQISSINKSQVGILENSNEVVSVEIVLNETEVVTRTTPEGETITATPQNPFVIDPNTRIKVYYNPELVTQEKVKQIIKNSTAEELQNIDLVNATGIKVISTEPLEQAGTEADFIQSILDEMERQKSVFAIPQAFADTGETAQEDSKINFDFDYRIIVAVVFIVIVLAGAAFFGGGASLG